MLTNNQIGMLLEEFSKRKIEFNKVDDLNLKQSHLTKIEEIYEGLSRNLNRINSDIRFKVEEVLKKEFNFILQMREEIKLKINESNSNNIKNHKPINSSVSNPSINKNDKTEKKDNNDLSDELKGAIITEKPNVKWSDVVGLNKAKEALQQAIILPTKFPEIFVGLRQPWKGILLYGVKLKAARYWKNIFS